MPPQQADGLLDFVDDDLRFSAHCVFPGRLMDDRRDT
jgi:hypothetical protein